MRNRGSHLPLALILLALPILPGCHDWARFEPGARDAGGGVDAGSADGGRQDGGLDAGPGDGGASDAGQDGGTDARVCASSCALFDELCTGDDRDRGCCDEACVAQGDRLLALAHMRPAGASPMTIDGLAMEWSGVPELSLTRWTSDGAGCPSVNNLRASFQVQWDAAGLYVLVTVRDDVTGIDTGGSYHEDDTVEVFVDLFGIPRVSSYGADAYQIFKKRAPASPPQILPAANDASRVEVAATNAADIYRVELAVTWGSVSPRLGKIIGFDVAVDDDDNVGGAMDRERRHVWSDLQRGASLVEGAGDPRQMGLVRLSGPFDTFPLEDLLCPEQCESRSAGYCSGTCEVCAPPASVVPEPYCAPIL